MKQHTSYAATSDGRKYNARERERMKSRYEIRQRVEGGLTNAFVEENDEIISRYLEYIRNGDRSKFSTRFMYSHFSTLLSPHPIRHILEDPITRSQTLQLLTKQNGPKHSLAIQSHIESLSRFTYIEYAVWLEKYSIVSALLHGGVNPCIRGYPSFSKDSLSHIGIRQQQQRRQEEIGSIVLKRFFDAFPLRLSTYIVTRVVRMRMIHRADSSIQCECCCISIDFLLQFNNCGHIFCEFCFWKNLLAFIDTPEKHLADDVVSCIICGETQKRSKISQSSMLGGCSSWEEIQGLKPSERCELSLQRLHQLPVNEKALKERSSKKKKVIEADYISSNWQQAILPSLGSTQDVRRDKFIVNVERNTIPFVRGCLLGGVDINQSNVYGHTAVYIAAWHGYNKLAKMLLDHGADPFIPANGGSTLFSICSIHKNMKVLEFIDQYHSSSAMVEADSGTLMTRYLKKIKKVLSTSFMPKYTTLISEFLDHPGAGSYLINEAISSSTVDILLKLFHSLPVDTNQKQKKNSAPCSDRSYYCDAEGSIRQLLGSIIERVVSDNEMSVSKSEVTVFPHMRFLNYSTSGTILPPHIDLCRADPFCSSSEKQSPNHKSTHTFILYLTNCQSGGETCLLECVSADGISDVLATVSPQRGRLLIFPHSTPHEGREVVDVPKILLRGEVQLREMTF